MKYFLLAILAIPLCALGQNSPPAAATVATSPLPTVPPAPDAAELTTLLRDFLAGASRNDPSAHERFWAEDLIYTGSSGRRIGKGDIMREVRAEGPPKSGAESTVYTAEDILVQQYGTTAILAFRLIGTTSKGDKTETTNYLNSGTFLKRDGRWQVVNWQATKMPVGKEK